MLLSFTLTEHEYNMVYLGLLELITTTKAPLLSVSDDARHFADWLKKQKHEQETQSQ
jgi:hypothetical protein